MTDDLTMMWEEVIVAWGGGRIPALSGGSKEDDDKPQLSFTVDAYQLSNDNLESYNCTDLLGATVGEKNTIFWDLTPCSLIEVYRRFGRRYCHYTQAQRVSQSSKKQTASFLEFDAA
jgi:hypothetical protein